MTVRLWVLRAAEKPLDQVNWEDDSHAPTRPANQTPQEVQARILTLRDELARNSDLGEYGAHAIRSSLLAEDNGAGASVPSTATINRILRQHGVFDVRRRVRRSPPSPGWYLPEVAAKRAEIDETDFVEDLAIEGGPIVFILNTISLHGGWCGSWPTVQMRAQFVRDCLLSHWREFGLPDYAQFDNSSIFYGTHYYSDVVGTVSRLCLGLNITPVFAVPREFGIQSSIESYNNRWQQKVWQRFHITSMTDLERYSSRYVAAARKKQAQRFEAAPGRRAFPANWSQPDRLARQGNIIYIRRTSDQGTVDILGQQFLIPSNWTNRLVRCEVDLAADVIRAYGLRRQEPSHQALLTEWPYRLPERRRKIVRHNQ